MGQPDRLPLTGYRVAVTAARRADELCALLRRRGAAVCAAPAITMVNLPADEDLLGNTEALISHPPDVVIATTGVGFGGWIAAADDWGLSSELIAALTGARIISRGPKATGAVRAAGLPEEWSPPAESAQEVLDYLLGSGVAGRRVAVQLHGATDIVAGPDLPGELRAAGADVVPIRTYRWQPAPRGGEFDALGVQIAHRGFDAVAFTSAPAVTATLMRAAELGVTGQLLAALRSEVCAICVGPVTAGPLTRLGIPTSSPRRTRLGALARHITDELPALRSQTVDAAGHRLEIRGTCVLVDDEVKELTGAEMATLRALARHPGAIVGRDDLLAALPGGGSDTHAVESAVLRLRTTLGDKQIVATVVKRGYRLAAEKRSGVA
jgi:uroporphyrinogen-III synthase